MPPRRSYRVGSTMASSSRRSPPWLTWVAGPRPLRQTHVDRAAPPRVWAARLRALHGSCEPSVTDVERGAPDVARDQPGDGSSVHGGGWGGVGLICARD